MAADEYEAIWEGLAQCAHDRRAIDEAELDLIVAARRGETTGRRPAR